MRVDLGFRVDRVLTFDVNLPTLDIATPNGEPDLHEDLARRLASVPGVTSPVATSRLPQPVP